MASSGGLLWANDGARHGSLAGQFSSSASCIPFYVQRTRRVRLYRRRLGRIDQGAAGSLRQNACDGTDRHDDADLSLIPVPDGQQVDGEVRSKATARIRQKKIQRVEGAPGSTDARGAGSSCFSNRHSTVNTANAGRFLKAVRSGSGHPHLFKQPLGTSALPLKAMKRFATLSPRKRTKCGVAVIDAKGLRAGKIYPQRMRMRMVN